MCRLIFWRHTGVVSGCAKEPEPSSGRSLLRLQGTLPPLLSSQITVISVITDHSDVDAAGPRIAFLFKVQGEEITGTQREAHYSGTSGIRPTPRASSDGETAHQH